MVYCLVARGRPVSARGPNGSQERNDAQVAASKRDVIQALNRARLEGNSKGALALGVLIDVLVDGPRVTLILADRVGDAPVSAAWRQALEAAAAGVPGVEAVAVEVKPSGTPAPSLQQAAQRARPALDFGDTRVLAVASGKGGVGKSTVTANVAVALTGLGLRVGAVDADIYGFSLPTLLGATEPPQVTADKRWEPPVASGVRLLSMDFFVPPGEAVVWRGPILGKALLEFFTKANWEGLDWLLLDLPPGTGDVALDVHEMLPSSEEIVITTPDPLAARVAVRAGQMAQKTGHRVLGVVENMASYTCPHCGEALSPFGSGGGARVADLLSVPVLAQVPLGGTARRGTGIFPPESETGRIFAEIARRLVEAPRG